MAIQTSSGMQGREKRPSRWKWRMPVQIAEAILEVEQRAAEGESIEVIAAELGISASSYHRWRSLYHGLNADDIAYTKRLESEVRRLRRIINEFEMDAPLPEEARMRALA